MGWWSRLTGRGAPAPAAAPAAAPAPAAPAPATASAEPQAAERAVPGYGVRRPLFGTGGELAGFAFTQPSSVAKRMQSADAVVQAVNAAALLMAMRPVVAEGRIALTRLPAAVFTRVSVQQQLVPGLWLLVDPAPANADEQAAVDTLRARGIQVGAPDGVPAQAPDVDFVVLAAVGGDIDTLVLSAQRWSEARPRVRRVAVDVACIEDIEQLLHSTVMLAAGQLTQSAVPRSQRPLQAAAHRICQLIGDLELDHPDAQVAAGVRADVALSYRLLRYVNSPALGLSRRIDSIEQALMVLGRKELSRWLSVLLLASTDGRHAARGLQELSLVRARLFETLAQQRGQAGEPPPALFTAGLLSLLGTLLEMPMAQALEPLPLSDDARRLLIGGEGPWADYLRLALALENHDAAALEPIAPLFGGPETVLQAADAAWAWAGSVCREMLGPDTAKGAWS